MKKILLFLLFSICLFSTSCAQEKTNPLEYQTYPFFVEGSLVCDETEYNFTLSMKDASNSEISFSSPDTLRGYTFNVTPDGTTLTYDDMTIDFNSHEKTSLVRLIPSLFSLSPDNFISNEKTTMNSTEILISKYSTDMGDISVYLNLQTATPLRFEGDGFYMDVLKFTPSSPSTPQPTEQP